MTLDLMPIQNHSILIFDSGVGGLSVHQKVRQALPDTDIHYVADHAAFPYGDKDESWLTSRVDKLISKLHHQFNPDVIIIACNTASTLALPVLRKHIRTPIIGVIPAIKTAAQLTQNQKIGLLATPGTISRTYIDDLIKDFASHCKVSRLGTTELVQVAEQKLAGIKIDVNKIRNILEPLLQANVDTIVLGCTHFPLLQDEIQVCAPNIMLVDSGDAIAKRATHFISNLKLTDTAIEQPSQSRKMQAYSTRPFTAALQQQLEQFGFTSFHHIHFTISESA